jgi:hypothetical protein
MFFSTAHHNLLVTRDKNVTAPEVHWTNPSNA